MSGAAARRRQEPAPKLQALDLLVFGYEGKFFYNATMAAEIEAGRHLMQCHGREDVLVDRFDVRLLLENLEQFERPSASAVFSEREQIEEAELDKLRYEDMEAADARLLAEEEKKRAVAGGGFHMVGFKYETEVKPADPPPSASPPDDIPVVPFAPPFAVLPGMILPSNARMHSIIDTTAKFVQKTGEQAEVRLRLQHKDNPSFSFMMIDDPLHAYYKYVRMLVSEGVDTAIPPPPPPPSSATNTSSVAVAPISAAAISAVAQVATPPPDQKLVIDKFVEMVVKHGATFEATVHQRDGANPRFGFLNAGNEWHAYYRKALDQARNPAPAGLVLLAAYTSDEECDDTPKPPPPPTQPDAAPPPPSLSSAPPPPPLPSLSPPPSTTEQIAPLSSANSAQDAAKEALRKLRLEKVKLLAAKVIATAPTASLKRSRSPSPPPKRDASSPKHHPAE